MSDLPLFRTPDELQTWNRIRGSRILGFISDRSGREREAARILASEGPVHPALLTAAMSVSPAGADDATADALLSKARPGDATPFAEAARIRSMRGDTDGALEVLSRCGPSADSAELQLCFAEVYLKAGDGVRARECALAAYGLDPFRDEVYEILEDTDRGGGWPQRQDIMRMVSGKKVSNQPGSGKWQELCNIYHDWYTGARDASLTKLRSSAHRRSGDPDFLLASARFLADGGDLRGAWKVYSGILDASPAFVRREAAGVLMRDGRFGEASEVLEGPGEGSPGTLELSLECRMRLGDRKGSAEVLDRYLASECVSLSDCIRTVGTMAGCGYVAEASRLAEGLSGIYPREPDVFVLLSRMRLLSGDTEGAASAASRAVRYGRDDPDARVQRARTALARGKAESAERECTDVLSEHPGHREALVLLKDVAASRGDDRKVLELCDAILKEDPDDVRVVASRAAALCGLGDCEGARAEYARCLEMEPSAEVSEKVVSMMISHGMLDEAVYACNDLMRAHPDKPVFGILKGRAEYAAGDFLKASRSFASASESMPEDPYVLCMRGRSEAGAGEDERAAESFRLALAPEGSLPTVLEQFEDAIETGSGSEIVPMAEALIERHAEDPGVKAALAKAFAALGPKGEIPPIEIPEDAWK